MTTRRNLELSERENAVREKRTVEVVDFDLDQIFNQFNENIGSVKAKFNIAAKLLDEDDESGYKDILRSQIVFLDSALDYYMHCITKYGMNKIFKGEWGKTEKYRKIMVPLNKVEHAIKNSEDTSWFSKFINEIYAKATFMDGKSIKEQFNLVGIDIKKVADDVFYQAGSTRKTTDQLNEFLTKLFYRRNSIAHQSDRLHEDGSKQEIKKPEVENYIDTVEKIVISIQNEIKNKNSSE